MKTFPIMMDLRGRRAVVVGGGPVGLRKARALAAAGAVVRVVDPAATAGALPKGAERLRRPYRASLLRRAAVVMACTDDPALNARVAADARRAGALVNVADRPDQCDFHLPAVAHDGDVVVAVGTGGSAPALAASLKRTLAAALPPRAGQFAATLADLRRRLKRSVSTPRRRMRIVKQLLAEGAYEEFLAAGPARLRRHLEDLVQSSACPGAGPARRPPRLRLLCVGVSHRTAGLAIREKLSMDGPRAAQALGQLAGRWAEEEFAVLSTCNRTELYAASTGLRPADLLSWLAGFGGLSRAALGRAAYRLADRQAVRHLFRVAAGLDSLVVGEQQIVAQLKDAYAAARQAHTARTVLNELFQTALHVAKHARAETPVAAGRASVASVAVDAVAQAIGPLAGRSALVVGAGRTAELVLQHLRRLRPEAVLVANRSPARAARLADACGAAALAWADLPAGLARCDVVLSCTASRQPVLGRDLVAAAMAGRRRGLLIVDLAVPRDVEPAVRQVPRVRLLDIDELRPVVRRSLRGRSAHRRAAQAVVEQHVEEFLESLRVRRVAPAIEALYRRLHQLAEEELADARRKLATHSDAARDEPILRRALHRTIRRLLHPAIVNLRRAAGSDAARLHLQSLRKLFELEERR